MVNVVFSNAFHIFCTFFLLRVSSTQRTMRIEYEPHQLIANLKFKWMFTSVTYNKYSRSVDLCTFN